MCKIRIFFLPKITILKIHSCKWLIYRRIIHGLKQFQKSWWKLVQACRLSGVLLNTSRLSRHNLRHPFVHSGQWYRTFFIMYKVRRLSGMQSTFGVGGITPSHSLCPNIRNSETRPLSSVGCSTQRAWPERGAHRWCVNSSGRWPTETHCSRSENLLCCTSEIVSKGF